MTGNAITKPTDNSRLEIIGGTNNDNAAFLQLESKNSYYQTVSGGGFALGCVDGAGQKSFLSGRGDGGLYWVTPTGVKEVKSMAFPSNTSIAIPITSGVTEFTAPANGWVWFEVVVLANNYASCAIISKGVNWVGAPTFGSALNPDAPRLLTPVTKGEAITLTYGITSGAIYSASAKFFYAEGEV